MAMMLFQRLALDGDLVARGPALLPLAIVTSLAGTAISASGTIASGKAAKDAGIRSMQAQEFKAAQYEQAAQESRASAQRAALERRRDVKLAESTLQARAASSGGGADDPTIVQLGENIAGRGEYQALGEMFRGENRARGLLDEATGARFTGEAELAAGKAKQQASEYSAAGTILSGVGTLFGKYGGGNKTKGLFDD